MNGNFNSILKWIIYKLGENILIIDEIFHIISLYFIFS